MKNDKCGPVKPAKGVEKIPPKPGNAGGKMPMPKPSPSHDRGPVSYPKVSK